jgi:hypothetical protein
MSEACSTHCKERGLYKVLVRKPEAEGPLGKASNISEKILKFSFKIGCVKVTLDSSGSEEWPVTGSCEQ